jgi:two-component system cell cycle sensor histidine kinase/response regulator CckA
MGNPLSQTSPPQPRRAALRIALVYAVVGALWILFSDRALGWLVSDPERIIGIAMLKGMAFIAVTAVLVYLLVRGYVESLRVSHLRLEESERRYRNIVNSAAEGLMVLGAGESGHIQLANARLAAMLGLAQEQIVGHAVLEFLTAESRAFVQRTRCLGGAAERTQVDLHFRRSDGGVLWTIASTVSLLDERGQPTSTLVLVTDVTERRRVEQELNHFFAVTVEMLCIARFDCTLLRVNPAFGRVLGYSRDELVGTSFMDYVHPDDRHATVQAVGQLAAGQEIINFENRYRHQDGSYRWLSWVSIPVVEEQLVYAAARDVTVQHQAEEALRASEQRVRYIVKHIPTAVAVYDRELRYIMVSDRYLQEHDLENRDIVGQRQAEVLPAIAARWSGVHGRCLAGAIERADEDQVVRSDGAVDWIRWECRPWYDSTGQIGGIIKYTETLTQRKRAEQALREGEARFRSIFEASPIGIQLFDTGGHLISANRASLEILGVSGPEALAQYCLFDDRSVPPDVWPQVRAGQPVRFETRFDCGGAERRALYETRRFGTIDLDVMLTPLGGEERRGYLVQMQDTTERRRLEEQLRQAQKMEAIGQLAGGVSHDFNNILTAIFANVELMRGALEDKSSRFPLRDGLDQIERSSQRAAVLTRQLLTFSRRQLIKSEVLDPNHLLREMEKMLVRLIREDVNLRLVLAPEVRCVRGDPGQIEQIIMNLVVNARDAMPTGGRIIVETSDVSLDAEYVEMHPEARPGPHVLLAVSDTGCGMDAHTLEHIFEPFFTTKPAGTGTGLGLATVHGIVKQLGGHIMVYSEVGRGSTFRIYLPAVAEQPTRPHTAPIAAVRGGSETVLICEDDDIVRELARHTLESQGYQVLAAESPERALALSTAHTGHIQLLVTDVVMPEMDGRQLAETLSARRNGLKVLYMSGYTSTVIADHGLVQSGIEFLEKPFTSSALLRRVREVLDAPPRSDTPNGDARRPV